MVTEDQSKHVEAPKKWSKLMKKIKLTWALFGAKVLDAISGEKPVIIEREPKKTVEMIDTSDIDWTLRKIEELEKNHKPSFEKDKFTSWIYQEFSEKFPNFKNNMKLQSEAEEFKQNSNSLKLIRKLYEEQKMPLGKYSWQKIEEIKENIYKSLTEEDWDLITYINFLPGKDILLLYRFMLLEDVEYVFWNLRQTLGRRSKEIELSLKLHQN